MTTPTVRTTACYDCAASTTGHCAAHPPAGVNTLMMVMYPCPRAQGPHHYAVGERYAVCQWCDKVLDLAPYDRTGEVRDGSA